MERLRRLQGRGASTPADLQGVTMHKAAPFLAWVAEAARNEF
jgi:hypothetical protein